MQLVSQHPFGAGGLHARMFRLGNGLKVILVRDPSAPVFAYQTWYAVGSRHEREGITGIAHLFEHLMFNQTANHSPGEFDRLIETLPATTFGEIRTMNRPRLLDRSLHRKEHLDEIERALR